MINTKLWINLAIASSLIIGITACSNSTAPTTPVAEQAAVNPCAANPCAGESSSTSFNVENGVAIKGTDPVAYFTQSAVVQGSDEFTYDWNGATWHFASAENRDLFVASPEQYAPQYGGYCAWAVSQNKLAPIDPAAWEIVDGKLYLNYDKKIQARWQKDIPGFIAKANENWPALLSR